MATRPEPYLIPNGFLLMLLGGLYALVAFTLISDALVLVMARRELSAYFYSPIAYIVLLVSVVVAGLAYVIFLGFIVPRGMNPQPPVEPIVQYYVIAWWPILTVLLTVPLITMGLLSEERRTGTLEVLLTAPVNETPVVVSKFLAALAFFQFICLPWGLYLLALRIQGGEPFDYRPLMSYLIAMTVTGAAFLSMGLFFSSLTRSQIAAAILTCAVLIGWVVIFFLRFDEAGGP
jgi:ABC-type transport system involved in multi-copper enzyme maturation permease subunit